MWGDLEGIDGYPYLNHLIELCPGGWVGRVSKINEEVGDRIQHQKLVGKRWLVQKNQTMSSGNSLGGFYQQLPMGRKYTGFVRVIPENN